MKDHLLFLLVLILLPAFSCQEPTEKNSYIRGMKKIINTSNAPAPIGPYSQAVIVNGMLFASGQIAIDPSTGNLVTGDIRSETKQVMENIRGVLNAAGMDFSNIVKTSIFLSDMNNFAQVNEVYGSYFSDNFPARETVEVSRLPKDVNVEISVIAVQHSTGL
jgi:2-iminobutanoate/2-iminopropanoate deaminase